MGPSINYVVSRGEGGGVKNCQFYFVKRQLRGGDVTEKPREVAGERLSCRLSTISSGKVASRFLVDVPIGNTKNAKALQVNKS